MIELGTFNKNVFNEIINNPENWRGYTCGSPAEGMPYKDISNTEFILKILKDWYDIKRIKWAKAHKMPPKTGISLHQDGKEGENCHVIHMVAKTNSNVIFCLNDEFLKMEEGKVYEIDNTLPHYVKNNGDTDRIHVMLVLEGYLK